MKWFYYKSDNDTFKQYMDILITESTIKEMRQIFMNDILKMTDNNIPFGEMPIFTAEQVGMSKLLTRSTKEHPARSDWFILDESKRSGRKLLKRWENALNENRINEHLTDEKMFDTQSFIYQFLKGQKKDNQLTIDWTIDEPVLYIESNLPVKPEYQSKFTEIEEDDFYDKFR